MSRLEKTLLEKERAQAEAHRRVQSLAEAIQEATTQIRLPNKELKVKKRF